MTEFVKRIPVVRQFSMFEVPVFSIFGEWSLLELSIVAGIGFLSLMIVKDVLQSLIMLGCAIAFLTWLKQQSKVLTLTKLSQAITRYIMLKLMRRS